MQRPEDTLSLGLDTTVRYLTAGHQNLSHNWGGDRMKHVENQSVRKNQCVRLSPQRP